MPIKKKPAIFEAIEGYLYLLPFLILYIIFKINMLVETFWLSFTDYKLLGDMNFIGFRNYIDLLNNDIFWSALKNTGFYVMTSTPIFIISAFFLALLINSKYLLGRAFFRTTFFSPQVLAVSVVATIGLYLFQSYTGLVNNLFKTLGLLAVDQEIFWFDSMFWFTVILLTLWWTVGFNMIIYIAGLQEIPQEYYEAAEMDGANALQRLWYITVPSLNRVHVMVIFLQLIASFKVFGQVFLLGQATEVSRTYIQFVYETGFRTFDIGRASAASLILFLIIFVISYSQFKITSKVLE